MLHDDILIPNVPPGTYRLEATPAAAALRTQQVREAGGFPDMRISKSGKLTVSLTCESASPGSWRFPRHANQQVREADGFPDMRISKSGKLTVSLTCESASPGS